MKNGLARELLISISKNEVDAVLEKENNKTHRGYYGASELGKQCNREMFLSFRKSTITKLPIRDDDIIVEGAKYRLLDRGTREEERFIKRLEPFFDIIYENNPTTGKQWAIENCEGHFRGHMDAKGLNFKLNGTVYPGWWLLEFKTANRKNFDKLAGAKRDTTNSIAKSKPEHYAQVQTYLAHDESMVGAIYICVCKDTDEWYIEIVERDPSVAIAELKRVSDIVWSKAVPERMPYASRTKNFYCSSFCKHNDVCFSIIEPVKTCRTCDLFTVVGKDFVCGNTSSILDRNDLTPCDQYSKFRL